METEQTKFSILMFPWLAYSHVIPFLQLAKTLSKNNRFQIYFCSSAVNLDLIKANLLKDSSSYDASIKLVELHLPSSPNLPPKFHTTKNLPSNLLPNLLQSFQNSSSSFSEILSTIQPNLLIYDIFQSWAPKLAKSQGIPSIYFATSGAAAFSFYHHQYTNGTFSTYPYQEIYLLDHEEAAVTPLVTPKTKDSDEDFAFGIFKQSSEIVLIKSLIGIEGKYLNYLSTLCQKKVVPTGPLVQDSSNFDESCSDILEWLSEKNQSSTVFICFGSEHFLSKEQIQEIAKGLELCDVNFIWVVRFPVEEKTLYLEDIFPSGFLERVKERGFIMQGWAPQAEILSHPSIGGFVSHCGWSSIMESLYFGVPVIALPIKFDQPINTRLVVNHGVGVEVNKDENGHFSGEEVAKAIKNVIVENAGESMRDRIRILSQKMRREEEEAVSEVSEQILELCIKNKKQLLLPVSSSDSRNCEYC